MILVDETAVGLKDWLPNWTIVIPVRSFPSMVTLVPPLAGPVVGDMDVMVGGL
jgi:hypothetical protein